MGVAVALEVSPWAFFFCGTVESGDVDMLALIQASTSQLYPKKPDAPASATSCRVRESFVLHILVSDKAWDRGQWMFVLCMCAGARVYARRVRCELFTALSRDVLNRAPRTDRIIFHSPPCLPHDSRSPHPTRVVYCSFRCPFYRTSATILAAAQR